MRTNRRIWHFPLAKRGIGNASWICPRISTTGNEIPKSIDKSRRQLPGRNNALCHVYCIISIFRTKARGCIPCVIQ